MPDDELYAVDTIDSGTDSLITSAAGREVGAGLAVTTSTGAASIVAGSMIGADSIILLATSGGVTAAGASIVGTITTGAASSGFVTAFGTNTAFSLGNAAALAASSAAALAFNVAASSANSALSFSQNFNLLNKLLSSALALGLITRAPVFSETSSGLARSLPEGTTSPRTVFNKSFSKSKMTRRCSIILPLSRI